MNLKRFCEGRICLKCILKKTKSVFSPVLSCIEISNCRLCGECWCPSKGQIMSWTWVIIDDATYLIQFRRAILFQTPGWPHSTPCQESGWSLTFKHPLDSPVYMVAVPCWQGVCAIPPTFLCPCRIKRWALFFGIPTIHEIASIFVGVRKYLNL